MLNPMVAIVAIVILSGLIITTFIVQTARTKRAPLGRVLDLYREVKYNENVARRFGYRGKVRRFRTEAWMRHKWDVDFLAEELRTQMAQAYEDIARLNEIIDASIERHQESHLNTVNTAPVQERLRPLLSQLDMWIKTNLNNPDFAPKRPRFLWW